MEIRGAYYKERSTRVAQPMLDARFDVSDDAELRVHGLVDSITSASAAAGAADTAFNERRWEGGGAYRHTLGRFSLGGALRISREPDYQSTFASFTGAVELANKNFTIALTLGAGKDDISNAGAQGGLSELLTEDLFTSLASLSVSQILSPRVIAGLTYDVSYLHGYQANLYRTVSAGGIPERERVPETRIRNALFGHVRGFLPATGSTLVTGYRFYFDDWGIVAHTPEVTVIQDLAENLALHLRFRHHHQSRADFFKTVYDTNDPAIEPYLTNDVKLSRFSAQSYAVKLDTRLDTLGIGGGWGRVRADVKLEYIAQHNRFGNAITGQLGFTVPFDY